MGDRRFVIQPSVDGLSLANLDIIDATQHALELAEVYAFDHSRGPCSLIEWVPAHGEEGGYGVLGRISPDFEDAVQTLDESQPLRQVIKLGRPTWKNAVKRWRSR